MAKNTSPIFFTSANVAVGQTITTANTAKDGTGTVVTVFTATSEESRPLGIVFRPTGTATQTVARIFVNNGSTNATATNNSLIGELALPSVTLSETTAQPEFRWTPPPDLILPSGYKLNVTLGTTVAAAYQVFGYGGNY